MPNVSKPHKPTTAFKTPEEVWFWCSKKSSCSPIARPCERQDILKVVERLYRQRRLRMDHLRVLVFYGARQSRPDIGRMTERRAFYLWREAMNALSAILEQQGWMHSRLERAVIDFSLERAQKASA